VGVSAQAQHKTIRLRNERIVPAPRAWDAAGPGGQSHPGRLSGLFLIQLSEGFDPVWRTELRARKVELLRYVPEDTFVARLSGARLEELEALPYVRWVGEYRPEHKVHASLLAAVPGHDRGGALAVTVLFSPAATAEEVAEARGRLAEVHQESSTRSGAILQG